MPGGYGWVFPKGDHANLGVGGWLAEGPRLRAHLARLAREHGLDPAALRDMRGHRLPMRRPGARPRAVASCSSATRPGSSIRSPATGSTRRSSPRGSRPRRSSRSAWTSTRRRSRTRSTATRRRRGRRSARSSARRAHACWRCARPASSTPSQGSSEASSRTRARPAASPGRRSSAQAARPRRLARSAQDLNPGSGLSLNPRRIGSRNGWHADQRGAMDLNAVLKRAVEEAPATST